MPGKMVWKVIIGVIGIAFIAGIIMGFVSIYNNFQPYELKIYTHLELDKAQVKEYRFIGRFCSYELYRGDQLIKKGFSLKTHIIDSKELADLVGSAEQNKNPGSFMVLIVDNKRSGTKEKGQQMPQKNEGK